MLLRAALVIKGIVQGVGFRPFIYRLADQHGLKGFVYNAPDGVICEAEGNREAVLAFIADIPEYKPHAAHISDMKYNFIDLKHDIDFRILPTRESGTRTVISPDLAICEKCKSELIDCSDRRFQYPFINCTDCGPRFSIIKAMPYDRPNTSMSDFRLCKECESEYLEPTNRRFHAEPNACDACGPKLHVYDADGTLLDQNWLEAALACLQAGSIVALKGIGGYHLAVDAENETAVCRLRERKHRYAKPLAVMMRDIDIVKEYCEFNKQEEAELCSKAAPIVILRKKTECKIASSVSLDKSSLGVFLPYSGIHFLLMQEMPALVLTSANISDEPICRTEKEAFAKLKGIADLFIAHDREIVHACDDSVLQFNSGKMQLIRRSRGYAPAAVSMNQCKKNLLACGGEQKNCFALSKENEAFLSAHIGDLHSYEAYQRYETELSEMCKLLEIDPQIAVCDMHPDYAATRFAEKIGLPVMKIQHHHAHFASVLAENKHDADAIGVIFDGTGLGTDGVLWGSEFLVGKAAESKRAAHLLPFALPGNESAIKEPWRIALSLASQALAGNELKTLLSSLPENAELLLKKSNWQQSCGMGRLFDGVAALLDIKRFADYEGQAAEILEEYANSVGYQTDISYHFDIIDVENSLIIDWRPVIRQIFADMMKGAEPREIALAFHKALADMVFKVCKDLGEKYNLNTIALSGGCFQNKLLLGKSIELLQRAGFNVLLNKEVPCNDGGLAYGQLAAAAAILQKEE